MINNENYSPGKAQLVDLIIIDDEESILNSLRSLLHREKFRINFFNSGIKALEFLEQHNVDVIMTDMRMPEISGTEILERSTTLCPSATRIVISGYEDKSVIMDAMLKGTTHHYVMKPWDDNQLRQLISDSINFQKELRRKHLLELLHSFRHIPSPPKLHSKLKTFLLDEQRHQRKITAEIEKSPALVARLITIANSVFYSVRKPISSVLEALSFIGTEAVLNLVLGLEAFDSVCRNAIPNAAAKIEDIRNKSVKRAQIAREISFLWQTNIDPQEAYVAGLMLDIGIVLRFCSSPEKFDKFFYLYENTKEPIFYIDKEVYSVTHDDISASLLTYWNFPEPVIMAVANHHRYSEGHELTTLVQVADAIIQEKDSLPHDPRIEGLAVEWTEKLHQIFNIDVSNY